MLARILLSASLFFSLTPAAAHAQAPAADDTETRATHAPTPAPYAPAVAVYTQLRPTEGATQMSSPTRSASEPRLELTEPRLDAMIGHSMLGLAATVGFGTGVFFLTLALEPDVGVGSIITSSLAALTVMPLLVGAGAHVGARRNGGVGRYGYAVLGAAVGMATGGVVAGLGGWLASGGSAAPWALGLGLGTIPVLSVLGAIIGSRLSHRHERRVQMNAGFAPTDGGGLVSLSGAF
ncbi:MAG: hypothetical protein AAF938_13885 [Myxococcota bacterium]